MLLFIYFIIGVVITIINVASIAEDDWDVSLTNIVIGIFFPLHSIFVIALIWVAFKINKLFDYIIEKLETRNINSHSIINLKDKFFKE